MNTANAVDVVPEATISAALVPDRDRMKVLPALFGEREMIRGEAMVYHFMKRLCERYEGGLWEFYQLSSGGWFMAPRSPERMLLRWADNWFEGEMTAEAAGIVVTLFALSHLGCAVAEQDPETAERLGTHYERLLDFASGHPESSLIYGAID